MYLGLSQANQINLIQISAWFGISAVTYLVILANCTLAHMLEHGCKNSASRYCIVIACFMLLASPILGEIHLSRSTGPTEQIRISTIQPMIASDIYRLAWQQPENRDYMLDTLRELTERAARQDTRMIFWSEGGNGHMNLRIPSLRDELMSFAKRHRIDLIVSSRDMDGEGRIFNSVFSISREGKILGRYDKQRLVPIAESELTSGSAAQPIKSSHGIIGAAICYESAFTEPLRHLTQKGAEILFVTSSDANFMNSSLALLHAQLAIFRAVENRRWLVRAANTGPSLVISPLGRVESQLGIMERGIMQGIIERRKETTVFTNYGHYLPDALAFAIVMMVIYRPFRLLNASHTPGWSKNRKGFRNGYKPIDTAKSLANTASILFLSLASIISASLFATNSATHEQGVLGRLAHMKPSPTADKEQQKISHERFMQSGKNTCGAAALAFVLSYLGQRTTESDITGMISIGDDGTSMLELKRAVEVVRFKGIGVRENYSALQSETLPVIAYINNNHYVVVINVLQHSLTIFDPSYGTVKLARGTFESVWNGYLLLIRPQPIPGLPEGRTDSEL